MLEASCATQADTDWVTMAPISRNCVLAPELAAVPLDRLIGVGRIIGVVFENARVGYGFLLTLLDRFALVFVGMLIRMTGSLLGRGDNRGFRHILLLRSRYAVTVIGEVAGAQSGKSPMRGRQALTGSTEAMAQYVETGAAKM